MLFYWAGFAAGWSYNTGTNVFTKQHIVIIKLSEDNAHSIPRQPGRLQYLPYGI